MKKILDSMKFGKYVVINELNPASNTNVVAGFTFEPSEDNLFDDQIISPSGEVYHEQNICFRCGNNLNVSLRDKLNPDDHTDFFLGSLFPDHNLIIGHNSGTLVFFAPICNSKMELANFLLQIDLFFKQNNTAFPWYVHDNFIDLALWLYKNNPGKKVENSWGI